jgi:hypothetical protein
MRAAKWPLVPTLPASTARAVRQSLAEVRKKRKQCLRQAKRAGNVQLKAQWLEMADDWQKVIESGEQLLSDGR